MYFTRRMFTNWLRKNPRRKLFCGDHRKCAIAQFLADRSGEIASVSGVTFALYPNKEAFKAREGVDNELPAWAQIFIGVFDHTDGAKRIKGKGRYLTGARTLRLLENKAV